MAQSEPSLSMDSLQILDAIERFEAAWRSGERPDIALFLPADGQPSPALLTPLVHIDLEQRLRAGEMARVEDYLRRFPVLAADASTVLELIVAEFQLRQPHEPGLDSGEYRRRFPDFEADLATEIDAWTHHPKGVQATSAADMLPPAQDGDTPPSLSPDTPSARRSPGAVAGSGSVVQVPGYEILGELGRGGMGVVYKARHVRLARIVALKMVLAGGHSGSEERVRFLAEAKAVAALQHPNIVQVFECGRHDGLPFLALEYVNGGSLHDRLRDGLLQPREATWLVEQLAGGIGAAHAKGIVHRDLKPRNILLAFPESSVPEQPPLRLCTPKISDFGLAKRLTTETGPDTQSGLTHTGAVLGTPSYMAPEQAEGKKEMGFAADTYALGAILYECLTGRPPFRGPTPLETLKQVMTADPVPVRQLQPACPRDLETIVLKCLEKETAKRYGSAQKLAEDLQCFLKHEPIHARPTSSWERGRKWVVRHPAWAALLLLSALVVLAVPLALLWHNSQLQDALTRAQESDAETKRYTVRLEKQLYARDIRLGLDLLSDGNVMDVLPIVDRHRPATAADMDHRGFEWGYLAEHAPRLRPSLRFPHEGRPRLLSYTSDGRFLIAALDGASGHPPLLHVWDRNTDKLHFQKDLPETVSANGNWLLTLSPDGKILAWLDKDQDRQAIVFFEVEGKTQIRQMPVDLGKQVTGLGFAADGKRIAIGVKGHNVDLVDWNSMKSQGFQCYGPNAFAFTRDGKTMITTSQVGTVGWHNLDGRGLSFPFFHNGPLQSLIVSHAGDLLAVGLEGAGVFLGSNAFFALEGIQDRNKGPWALAFSPKDDTLAVGFQDGTLHFYDGKTRRRTNLLRWPGREIGALAYSSDGQELAFSTSDGEVHRFGAPFPPAWERWYPSMQVEERCAQALSPDGKTLALVVNHQAVHLIDVATGKVRKTIPTPEGQITQLAYCANGRTLVTMKERVPFVRFWNAHTGGLQRTLPLMELIHRPLVMAISPSGKLLLASNAVSTYSCTLWDVDSGNRRVDIPPYDFKEITIAQFSPDGNILALSFSNGIIHLWDVATLVENGDPARKSALKPFAELKTENHFIAMAFAPDSRMLAATAITEGTYLWKLQGSTKPELLTVKSPLPALPGMKGLQFSGDGRTLLTAGSDSCRITDVLTRCTHSAAPSGGTSAPKRSGRWVVAAWSLFGRWLSHPAAP